MLSLALLLIAAPAIEVEASSGVAIADPNSPLEGAWGIPVMFRAGVALIDELTLSAAFLAVPGDESTSTSCGGPCHGNAAFKAVSGFAILRGHTKGTIQVFGDAGIGIGHLIRVSADDLFENPAKEGRAGPAYWLGAGLRGVTAQGLTIGIEAAWTRWTNVSRPGFVSGITQVPASSDLAVDALLLLVNVGWAFGM